MNPPDSLEQDVLLAVKTATGIAIAVTGYWIGVPALIFAGLVIAIPCGALLVLG